MKVVMRACLVSGLFRELPASLREEQTDESRPWQVVDVSPRPSRIVLTSGSILFSRAFLLRGLGFRHYEAAVSAASRGYARERPRT
jgi:hypothetical protein